MSLFFCQHLNFLRQLDLTISHSFLQFRIKMNPLLVYSHPVNVSTAVSPCSETNSSRWRNWMSPRKAESGWALLRGWRDQRCFCSEGSNLGFEVRYPHETMNCILYSSKDLQPEKWHQCWQQRYILVPAEARDPLPVSPLLHTNSDKHQGFRSPAAPMVPRRPRTMQGFCSSLESSLCIWHSEASHGDIGREGNGTKTSVCLDTRISSSAI